jgi:hypothetical protein
MGRERTTKPKSNKAETETESTTETSTAPAGGMAPETATEGNEEGPSFAEKVGQKTWIPAPDPFGIASDYVVGVRLFESKRDRQMAIKFGEGRPEDKPSQEVIDTMKEAGYRWNPSNKIWAHPVRFDSAMSTRIDAERLYQKVCEMIRTEKGIETGPEIPF